MRCPNCKHEWEPDPYADMQRAMFKRMEINRENEAAEQGERATPEQVRAALTEARQYAANIGVEYEAMLPREDEEHA